MMIFGNTAIEKRPKPCERCSHLLLGPVKTVYGNITCKACYAKFLFTLCQNYPNLNSQERKLMLDVWKKSEYETIEQFFQREMEKLA